MYTHWTENNQWINYIYIFKVQQNVWIKPKIHSGSTSHDGKSFLIANIVPISSHTLLTSIHYSKRQMQFGQNKISHLMVNFLTLRTAYPMHSLDLHSFSVADPYHSLKRQMIIKINADFFVFLFNLLFWNRFCSSLEYNINDPLLFI